jgi:transcriptional regulator with XRE-family HTH domain
MNVIDPFLEERRLKQTLPDPATRRALRRRFGISQEILAAVLERDRTTVSKYELGLLTPRGEVLRRYAQVLEQLAQEGQEGPDQAAPPGRTKAEHGAVAADLRRVRPTRTPTPHGGDA